MKPYWKNPYSFDLDLELKETERQGKEIFLFQNIDMSFFDGKLFLEPNRKRLTDLSSTPKFMQGIYGFKPSFYKRSSIVHDDVCANEGLWCEGSFVVFTRSESDELFRIMTIAEAELLYHDKPIRKMLCQRLLSPIYWAGVRIGGFLGYGKPASKGK